MYILGISEYYHDSANVLLKDGIIVSALQEEIFSRKKHDACFQKNAIEKCFSNFTDEFKNLKNLGIYYFMSNNNFLTSYERLFC